MPKITIHRRATQRPGAVALSSQEAQWRRLEVVTNNLANAQTPGFKSVFLKLERAYEKNRTKGSRPISYVRADKQSRDLANGAFRPTDNPLDVCLAGSGFFMTENSKGKFFTRNGQFAKSVSGELVTAGDGTPVLGETGTPILIPNETKNLAITASGEVYGDGDFLGKIGVFAFANSREGLRNVGNGLYAPVPGNDPQACETYRITQGGLEESNVSAMEEGILLIKILREYENAQKIIEQDDQNKRMALNVSSKNG